MALYQNHACRITDGPQYDDEPRYEPENDEPTDEDRMRAAEDRDRELARRLNNAVRRISDSGCFDQRDLIELLKEARDRIDQTPTLLREQAG